MTTTTTTTNPKYHTLIGPTNIFQTECAQIVENIRNSIKENVSTDCENAVAQSRCSSIERYRTPTTFSFQEKRQQFLLLNVHCERELRTLTKELTNQKKVIEYKIVYNTEKPYNIYYDKPQSKVIITQHSFL